MAGKIVTEKEAADNRRKYNTANKLKWDAIESREAKETEVFKDPAKTKAAREALNKDILKYAEPTEKLISEIGPREATPSSIADQLQTDRNERAYKNWEKSQGMKKGGSVKSKCACGGGKMAKGGMARSSASKRADGIAIRGKTRA